MIILPEGDIQLWGVTFGSENSFFNSCKEALTPEEGKRVSFFHFKNVQNNYVISQGGLRLLLSEYLNKEPQLINIKKHSKGKPFTSDDLSLYFNMSNSGKHCVYAFSRGNEVGIDLEEIRFLPDLDELIEKNFTSKERKYINQSKSDQVEKFFQFWTIKESYLKATGEGMRLTPENIEISLKNEQIKIELVNGIFEHDDWLFKRFRLKENYIGTICYKNEKSTIGAMRFFDMNYSKKTL